jgi:uncharacterized protein
MSGSDFVWYELMTSDAKAAKAFYTKVVGWGTEDMPMPGMTYTMLKSGGANAAGLFELTDEMTKMGAQPAWVGYIGVENVDKAAEKVKSLGGAVHRPPSDIPHVGRFAIVADPQGAMFALFQPEDASQEGPAPQEGEAGRTAWNELYTSDWKKGFDFYSAMFGWTKGEAMDMGPQGTYQIFNLGDRMLGGMMNRPAEMPMSAWTYYTNVDGGIEAAAKRVKDGGGKVIVGPMEVPGGQWIVQGIDPQGAHFALIGAKG